MFSPTIRRVALSLMSATVIAGAAAAQERVLNYVPSADIKVFDPYVNTALITSQHAYMIYDVLMGFDREFRAQPQMAESVTVSADGLLYTVKLRPGLAWHDGSPVTSADVVASLDRWSKRDANGRRMRDLGLQLATVDVATVTLTMKEKWGLVLDSLARSGSYATTIMRAKDLPGDPAVPATGHVGSGPYRFVESELVPGSRLVYARNADYRPRPEAPSYYAGGKVVNFDKVVWQIIPDSASAINALGRGEIDMIEQPPVDLLPLLKQNKDVIVRPLNPFGWQSYARPNHLHPPFNKPEARQALMALIDQKDFLGTAFNDPAFYRNCFSFLACGAAMSTEVGMDAYRKPDIARAKALMQAAGSKGEKLVGLHASDLKWVHDMTTVLEGRMREAGWNVDAQHQDWATVSARRVRQEPPDQGGWNLFVSASSPPDMSDVAGSAILNSDCNRGGWFGWPCDEETQKLRNAWALEPDLGKRKAIAEQVQLRSAETMPFVPLGQFLLPFAHRANLVDIQDTLGPVFWSIRRR